MAKLERDFQKKLIDEIKKRFSGCVVMKLDPDYIQGVPDLLVLFGNKWATLECKRSLSAGRRPNQAYYVEKLNGMSFSRFVCPENAQDVLGELAAYFSKT